MEESVNQRLKRFIIKLGMSYSDFGESIGITRQHLDNWITREVKIPIPMLTKIALKYPELDVRWLLTGRFDENFDNVNLVKPDFYSKNSINILSPEKEEIFFQTNHIRESVNQMVHMLNNLQSRYDQLVKDELEMLNKEKHLKENENNEQKGDSKKKIDKVMGSASYFANSAIIIINVIEFILNDPNILK